MNVSRKASSPCRILVVDDNRDAADSVNALMELYGHKCRVAYDGKKALELLSAYEPQVALIDISMPDINGYDLAGEFRRRATHHMILCALTGWGEQGQEQKAIDAGFDHYLLKPADIDELLRIIDTLPCAAASREAQVA